VWIRILLLTLRGMCGGREVCCRRGGERTAKRRGQVLLAIKSLVIHRTHSKPLVRRTARVRLMGWDDRGITCGCDKVGSQSPSGPLAPAARSLVAPRETLSSALLSTSAFKSASWVRPWPATSSAAQLNSARPRAGKRKSHLPSARQAPSACTVCRKHLPAVSTFITPTTKQCPLRCASLSRLAPLRRISANRAQVEDEMHPGLEARCSPARWAWVVASRLPSRGYGRLAQVALCARTRPSSTSRPTKPDFC
jgi:hypothetical protein